MAIILSIETATSVCSVALHENDRLLALSEISSPNSHGKMIMPMIDEIFDIAKIDKREIDAVAVSSGPGSYTGLRIGVSTAKGFVFALGVPLIEVNTLEGLAQQVTECDIRQGSVIIPLLDARRMEVYCSVYSYDLKELSPTEALDIDQATFSNWLEKGEVIFVGDGSDKLRQVLNHSNAFFPGFVNTAKSIGKIAFRKFNQKEFVDLAYFEPNYLKEFIALKSTKNPLLQ
ncbi:tRNA (adenosine(37)-N6)-threonylcarbamoyltransferase complex dimerization subunit type 1 TsaB [Arthrospiribacter ruber]|uniref:tRNA (Adenosine(37)-N6)-threonylcarbamoyltransferase complex dimerization subunit type 1 TsaB n=1 Tax=Arthrospiribacter ruber TaxID=2487934 RepID=A0A951J528_9BACT|nr:tRNA (adenosine(37)-N6)-threonylcarbamoyltransferase complex dimerization subunit type 1 TsaB [Arthrospiribacter ruber]MBW3470147.1 tRNA (adenosine(37)-N6)-threonylcarbamoyltransferase complex dimerization subunit type 1 TsaB [Arthrospiribacter ruber]